MESSCHRLCSSTVRILGSLTLAYSVCQAFTFTAVNTYLTHVSAELQLLFKSSNSTPLLDVGSPPPCAASS